MERLSISILRPTLRSAEDWQNEATPSFPVTPGCTILGMWRLGREESESAAARIGESQANRYETSQHGSTLQRGLGLSRSSLWVTAPARTPYANIKRKR